MLLTGYPLSDTQLYFIQIVVTVHPPFLQEQNEAQLKILRGELGELKKVKVKLMRQMREEMSKAKQREDKISRQLESMIKDNRKRDIQIKNLKSDQKQKDLILKRKQEEVSAYCHCFLCFSSWSGESRECCQPL